MSCLKNSMEEKTEKAQDECLSYSILLLFASDKPSYISPRILFNLYFPLIMMGIAGILILERVEVNIIKPFSNKLKQVWNLEQYHSDNINVNLNKQWRVQYYIIFILWFAKRAQEPTQVKLVLTVFVVRI